MEDTTVKIRFAVGIAAFVMFIAIGSTILITRAVSLKTPQTQTQELTDKSIKDAEDAAVTAANAAQSARKAADSTRSTAESAQNSLEDVAKSAHDAAKNAYEQKENASSAK